MKAVCIGSSSSGNCYLMQFSTDSYTQTIMVEAGFNYKEITKRAVQSKAEGMLEKVNACIITHNHKDHCAGVPDLLDRGVKVYATREVYSTMKKKPKLLDMYYEEIFPDIDYCIAPDIFIHPFLVEHDAPNSLGFIIVCQKTKEKVLFINDCKFTKADISAFKYDYIFIECNYEDRQTHTLYSLAVKENDQPRIGQYKRILNAHMGLKQAIKLVLKLDLTKCKAIFLMHLSERHANEYLMKNEMKEKTGVPTYVCGKIGGIK